MLCTLKTPEERTGRCTPTCTAICPTRSRRRLPDGDDAFERWLDPEHTAIVCIDMHRGHIGPEAELPCPRAEGPVSGSPRTTPSTPRRARSTSRSSTPSTGSATAGIDDVESRHVNRGANWRHLYNLFLPPNPLTRELNWEGTKWLDLLVEDDPRDLHIRTKKRLSAFYPTDLEFLLRQLDVHNVVLTGTLTDCCVLSTAFSAADRDFRVLVPRDVTAGLSDEVEHASLTIIAMHLGLVVDAPELLAEWYARRGETLPPALRDAQTITEAIGATGLTRASSGVAPRRVVRGRGTDEVGPTGGDELAERVGGWPCRRADRCRAAAARRRCDARAARAPRRRG